MIISISAKDILFMTFYRSFKTKATAFLLINYKVIKKYSH